MERASNLALIVVVVIASLSSCSAPPARVPTTVLIEPFGVLLVPESSSRPLSAVVLDQSGDVMPDASVAWSSSSPTIIAVTNAGVVTALGPVGSATVTATAGAVRAQIAVISAVPAAGTTLVKDTDVLAGPSPVDPAQTFEVGALYEYTLAIAPPAIGTYVLGLGTVPVAGRVAAVDGDVVTVEIVPLDEQFVELDIDESLDLSAAPMKTDGATFDLVATRSGDGRLHVHGSVSGSSSGAQTVQPQAKFTVGNLECASDFNFAQLEVLNFNIAFTPALSFDVVFNEHRKKVVVHGSPTVVAAFEPAIKGALQESVSCEFTFGNIQIPLPPPVGLFLGGVVPVGVGFKLEGSVPLANVGYHFDAEVGADVKVGFDCNPSCEGVAELDPHVTGHQRPILPGDLFGLSLESSLFGYMFAGLEAGLRFSREGRVEIAKSQTGIKLTAKLAGEDTQFQDPSYASEYGLDFVANISAGKDIQAFFNLISVAPAQLKLELSSAIATSPKSADISADVESFAVGDTVTFDIELAPGSTNFPIIGYNVDSVRIYNVMSGSLVLANEVSANPGQSSFEIPWVATQDGDVTDNFVAFVTSRLLPGLRLELGTPKTTVGGGTAVLTFTVDYLRSYVETAPNYDATYEETESYSGAYAFDVVSRDADTILFEVVSGTLDYSQAIEEHEALQGEMGSEPGCTYTKTIDITYLAAGSLVVPPGTSGTYRVDLQPNADYHMAFAPDLVFIVPYQDNYKVNGGCGVDGANETEFGDDHVSAFFEIDGTQDPANPDLFAGTLVLGTPDDGYHITWSLSITPP